MPLRQRLENLPVGQKLLAALLVLLTTVLLVANLTFISAAYYISQESMAPQALQTIGRLVSNPSLVAEALQSPQSAERLLKELDSYSPLRAAALYDGKGERLAQLQHGDKLKLPERYRHIEAWQLTEFRSNQLITLPRPGTAQGLAEETRHTNRKLELEVQVRSKIEKKLTGFQNYLNSIIDSMPSALIALDEQLYVTQWNQEASALSGTRLDEALNQPIFLAFEPLKPFLPQLKQTVEQHTVAKIERVTWFKDDEPKHYALTFYPLMGGAGRGVVIRIDDITQRLSLEEMMVQSEKMLSVGGLAAGMAHEINNPLGAILHNVQNIRRRLSPDLPKNLEQAEQLGIELDTVNRYLQGREVPQLLDGIQQAGARAAKIVTHMLSFSRRSNRQMAPCDLPALIDQAVEIAGNDFDLAIGFDFKGQAIIRQFDPALGPVPGTANELEQVLLNLLKNAAQAIHQREDDSEPGRITLRTRLNPPWAEIQVEDNGIGMSENVRKRTFEPFFTTKEIGQGTGLGLSVSYFIITNNHKGQMEVQSAPGQGTCFTLRLPLAQPAPIAAETNQLPR